MKNKKLTEAQKTKLGEKTLTIESNLGDDTIYAIHKKRKGMWIVQKGNEIQVAAENIIPFAREILDIWELYGKGGAQQC